MRSPLALISPPAAVAFSLTAAAAVVLFPPAVYREMVGEPNYIFLNGRAVLFIALCVAAFGVGYAVFHLARRWPVVLDPKDAQSGPDSPIGTELLLGCLLVVAHAAVLLLFIRTISLDALLAAMVGQTRSTAMRQTLGDLLDQYNLGSLMVVARVVLPWLAWCYLSRRSTGAAGRRPLGLVFFLLLAAHLSALLLIGGRSGILLVIFGLLLVGGLHQWSRGRLRWKSSILIGSAAAVFALVLFGVVANSRRGLSPSEWEMAYVVEDVTAYYAGSYNRLAAITNGVLHMPGAGGGYYWTGWLWEFPVAQSVLGLDELAEYAYQERPVAGWFEVSPHIGSIGFNRTYTSLTVFSFSFADFGWAGFLPFIPYGFLAAYCWHRFRAGRMVGVIVYPVVLWSILEWRGYIEIARPENAYIILTLLFLGMGHVMERSLMKGHPHAVPESSQPGSASSRSRAETTGPSHA